MRLSAMLVSMGLVCFTTVTRAELPVAPAPQPVIEVLPSYQPEPPPLPSLIPIEAPLPPAPNTAPLISDSVPELVPVVVPPFELPAGGGYVLEFDPGSLALQAVRPLPPGCSWGTCIVTVACANGAVYYFDYLDAAIDASTHQCLTSNWGMYEVASAICRAAGSTLASYNGVER